MTLLAANASLAQERPNIALIISDDQGWYGLAVQLTEKAAELEAMLDEYLASVDAALPVANPDYDPAQPSGWIGGRPRRGGGPNDFSPFDNAGPPQSEASRIVERFDCQPNP